MIGTDGGLLDRARTVEGVFTLNPAERVDLVVDFARFPNKKLRLLNTVPTAAAGAPAPQVGVPLPEVMQFQVGGAGRYGSGAVPVKISDFTRITAAVVPRDAVSAS